MTSLAGSRTPKYKHSIDEVIFPLTKAQRALLCILFLRGAQTTGELRGRTERMHAFADLIAVENALTGLIEHEDGPMVKCLPPGGGRKAKTFAHLLCGDVESPAAASAPVLAPAATPRASAVSAEWKEQIESELASLREELSLVRNSLDEFKGQFG